MLNTIGVDFVHINIYSKNRKLNMLIKMDKKLKLYQYFIKIYSFLVGYSWSITISYNNKWLLSWC